MTYNVFLAIPGPNLSWGSLVGSINASDKHNLFFENSSISYACQVAFNECWVKALNKYNAGEITHFVMLHSDIFPVTKNWVDILIDILDQKNAELVSVPSPLKDGRGITSTGIGDQINCFGAIKRFTIKEIAQFPNVFNQIDAGYANKVLLHNTGCWACDLRKPVFHLTNPDGSLLLYFKFIEKVVRSNNQWLRVQESEDWHFSRLLWEHGEKNSWITKDIQLIHYGPSCWTNWDDKGLDIDSDSLLNKPDLSLLGRIAFELGSKCNLCYLHKQCPNLSPERYSRLDTDKELTDEIILKIIVDAYNKYNFNGLISWMYYNEPLLQQDRMFSLMNKAKEVVPNVKFLLWTNGTLIPENCEKYRQFHTIIVTEYDESSTTGINRLRNKKINVDIIKNHQFDNRIEKIVSNQHTKSCSTPFGEMIIDNYGNLHLCCYDWKGEASYANVFKESFDIIVEKWYDLSRTIFYEPMLEKAPEICKTCYHKHSVTFGQYATKNLHSIRYDENGNEIIITPE